MSYSNKQIEGITSEALSDRAVLISCEKHGPVSLATPPQAGCVGCWKAYYILLLGKTPPHLRAQRLDELEMAVTHACEAEASGKWDFVPYEHPHIKIIQED